MVQLMDVRLFLKKILLKNTFIGWILLVSLVPLLIITYLAITASSSALHLEITKNLTHIANKKISDIENFFTTNKRDANNLSKNLTLIADDPITLLEKHHQQHNQTVSNKLVTYLTNFLEQRNYLDILILSPTGKVIYSLKQPNLIGKDYTLMPFKNTELGKVFDNAKTLLETALSDIEQTIPQNEKALYIASPILNQNEKLLGVLVLKMSNADIEKVIKSTEDLGNTGETLVGTIKNGHIELVSALRHISIADFMREKDLINEKFLAAFNDATIGKKGIGEFTDHRDKKVLAVWRYLPSMRWGMLIKIDYDEVLKPILLLKKSIVTLGIMTLLFAITLGYMIALRLQQAENKRKRLFSELEIARNEALCANRAKSAFLANMSHELRTPLNAIIGYSEMLIDEATDQGATQLIEDLQTIRGAGKNLLDLINDVLDISKIEAGRMDIYVEDIKLVSLLEDIRSLVVPLMKKKNNHFQLKLSEDIGDIKSDLIKLRQCLLNLLSNASKFTENGSITLKVNRIKRTGQEWIQFSVSDTGIGMTKEQQTKLFQVFSQVDASTTRKYGGTGLGLYLTQHFAGLLGGEINVKSEIDKGSTFTLTIPAIINVIKEETIPKVIERFPSESRASATELPTVLVIDDDLKFHQLINDSLGQYFHLIHAYNGEEGIAMSRKQQPDAITLDVMMPGMDGWSVLSELRSDPKVFMIPVIMVTITGDKELGYTLGVADFLNKPINVPLLMNKLYQYMGKKLPNILIIEDDLSVRSMLARTLRKAGMEVREVANGLEALKSIENNKPSIILLDLIMPVMDGFELLDQMRRKKITDIPVIVLTSKDITQEDRELLNGLVKSIIKKSAYHRNELINIIRQQLNESVQLTRNYQSGLIDHPTQKTMTSLYAKPTDANDALANPTLLRLNHIQLRIRDYIEIIHQCLHYFHASDIEWINQEDTDNVENIELGIASFENTLADFSIVIQQEPLSEDKLTTIRHDLRNSLNIIKGYSEIFLEQLKDNKKGEISGYFAIIMAAVNQILPMIELIKVTSGQ